MQIYESWSDAIVIVEPRGRIDSGTAPVLEERLQALISGGSARVIVDLTNIAYISSAGFRVLLLAARRSNEMRGGLVLCGVAGEVRRLFDIGAFTDIFDIRATREDGLVVLQ